MDDPLNPAGAEDDQQSTAADQRPPATTAPPLAVYHGKRDFARTPEPAGGTAVPNPERPTFCVQKHAASRLHYDFRLEVDGVLKSWAVPKGPSLDPADKRLAVMTEDHPLEYLEFEGTIPAGEYGGGTVMLWDLGWWEIDNDWGAKAAARGHRYEPVTDPAAGLAKGELKILLHGRKLTGSWALVQMKGRGEANWLLIKHRDDAARPGVDIEGEAPDSVATGRSLEQIDKGGGA
jgi:bifunctional non-homologous end joining protein LigD